jgi:SAM-dependent methyltransferase
VVVLDYGCGDGGYWRDVLQNYSALKLVGYDPSPARIEAARQNLEGLNAVVYTGKNPDAITTQADYIVSFSVLEHVYDRNAYLAKVKELLKDDGVFYLSYDDGHFRQKVNISQKNIRKSLLVIGQEIQNMMAPFLPYIGMVGKYQQRVVRKDIDELVGRHFRIVDERYENLESMRGIYRWLPVDKQKEFALFWLEVEEQLNERFAVEVDPFLGDHINLWKDLLSRTLKLAHHI